MDFFGYNTNSKPIETTARRVTQASSAEINEIACSDIPPEGLKYCMTVRDGTACSSGTALFLNEYSGALSYNQAFKKQKDNCYQVSNINDAATAYVMSRNVRGAGKTISDVIHKHKTTP